MKDDSPKLIENQTDRRIVYHANRRIPSEMISITALQFTSIKLLLNTTELTLL